MALNCDQSRNIFNPRTSVQNEIPKPEIASGIATAINRFDKKVKIHGAVATIKMDKEKIPRLDWPFKINETDERSKDIDKHAKKATETK